jgi:hypothetical protein
MRKATFAKPNSATTRALRTSARRAAETPFAGDPPNLQKQKEEKMNPNSKKLTASAATLFTFAFFVITAPTVHAEEYCITGGAQAAHGCGYPNMEACKAASAGIGGTCSAVPSNNNPTDALAKQPHSRSELRQKKESTTAQ